MNELRALLAKRLDEELDSRKWKPADLHRASGVSTAQISDIRSGKKACGLDLLERFAEALKVPAWVLLAEPGSAALLRYYAQAGEAGQAVILSVARAQALQAGSESSS